MFEKPIKPSLVMYSCTDDKFMIFNAKGTTKRYDSDGNKYKREEYEKKLPLLYARQLMMHGTMPDTIKGVAIDLKDFMQTKSTYRYTPEDSHKPQPKLFPLFEAESGRATLEMPEDYFRINWRVDFITAKDNTINEEKSRLFSAALYQKGFKFPAKIIAGIPTTRKSCDEGYLLVDSEAQVFHLKMMLGRPFVVKIKKPNELKFKHIDCVDFKDKRYYAYLFSENNEIFVLTQDDYKLIKLPIDGFCAETCKLKILGDFFNYNITIEKEGSLVTYALDKDFKIIDKYEENWLKKSERVEGKVFASIFPAQLSLENPNSKFIDFYIDFSTGFVWIFVNIILFITQLVIIKRRGVELKNHFFDLIIISVTGILGFIPVNIFPNK